MVQDFLKHSKCSSHLHTSFHPFPFLFTDFVFKITGKVEIPRMVFESMRPGQCLHISAVLLWSVILNYEEQFRSKEKMHRLFCTQAMLKDVTYMKSSKEMNEEFSKEMQTVMKDVQKPNIIAFGLVFIPILQGDHFFVMCFNLKRGTVEILENSASQPKKKYSGWPEKMRDAFVDYLIKASHPTARYIKDAQIKRLEMPWRTRANGIDCGVFAMRHMETYMGNGVTSWKCGLAKEQDDTQSQLRQLDDLRRKYVAKMLLHKLNERKYLLLKDVRRYLSQPYQVLNELEKTADNRVTKRMALSIDKAEKKKNNEGKKDVGKGKKVVGKGKKKNN